VTAHLYGMAHSHPVLAVKLMLEAADVPYEAHDIFPGFHSLVTRAKGFPKWIVPALDLDGTKLQSTLKISRELDRRAPEAGLFPRDPEARRAVEEAERWGHDELQTVARRVFRWAGIKDNGVRAWMAREVIHAPAPTAVGMAFKPAMVVFGRYISKADDATVRADLQRLPALLDHIDELVERGVIGGERPNAADFQIFTSLRLLMAHEDLRPFIEPRPSGQAALRLLPGFPRPGAGAMAPVPAALPPAWLPA